MKHQNRILSLVLSVVMLFAASAASSHGTVSASESADPHVYISGSHIVYEGGTYDYIIHDRFYNDNYDWIYKQLLYRDFGYWRLNYSDDFARGGVESFTRLWMDWYEFDDGTVWPEEYLEVINERISANDDSLRGIDVMPAVNGYHWHGSRMVIFDCSIMYDYEYVWAKDTTNNTIVYLQCRSNESNDDDLRSVSVIIDRQTGKAIDAMDNGELFDSSDGTFKKLPDEIVESEDFNPEDHSYSAEEKNMVRVTVPQYFDPELHELRLYITSDGWFTPYWALSKFVYACTVSDYEGYNNVYSYGDVNHDGKLNLVDAALLMRYIADWDVKIDTDLADTDHSGNLSLSDVRVILMKIVKS